MKITFGVAEYEIEGMGYGQFPAWKLIKQGGQPMTHDTFNSLPEPDKQALVTHVYEHLQNILRE
jgi:hypothetical protein